MTTTGPSTKTTNTPRPPEGDWLGTQYLRFTREGAFGVCTLDRPEARNAMNTRHVLRNPVRGPARRRRP